MKFIIFLVSFLPFICACNPDKDAGTTNHVKFDKIKWQTKDSGGYAYRNNMLDDLIDSVTLKGLRHDSLISLLGQPDRIDNGHLFYNIHRKEIVSFTLSTKTFVIKLIQDSTVEWRKIHGG